MSSILTNTSAMVALQTMKNINAGLGQVQSEISTGKTVNSAKDNAAVWAISKTMESDVSSFKGVTDSLAVGSSTVAVARTAAESVVDRLTEMKTKIVAAQGGSADDRKKLDTDIQALTKQIESVVSAAQFNGVNLVDGSSTDALNVLSSLDRSADGVEAKNIEVARNSLSTAAGGAPAAVFANSTGVGADSSGAAFAVATTDAAASTLEIDASTLAAGDKLSVTIGDKTASYTVKASDLEAGSSGNALVAVGLKNAIAELGVEGVDVVYDEDNPNQIAFSAATGADPTTISASFTDGEAGGLAALKTMDVLTTASAKTALETIDGLIKVATDAAASFGSSEKQISMQSDFVSKLSDTLKTGIGSMVDANMEEASARLQALQVQQQLGIQSLSIANQAPQSIMSLFR